MATSGQSSPMVGPWYGKPEVCGSNAELDLFFTSIIWLVNLFKNLVCGNFENNGSYLKANKYFLFKIKKRLKMWVQDHHGFLNRCIDLFCVLLFLNTRGK